MPLPKWPPRATLRSPLSTRSTEHTDNGPLSSLSSRHQRTSCATEASDQKSSTLLELPAEILDMILLNTIEIPWHPSCATFLTRSMEGLFTVSALHVNRSLRRRSFHLIAQECLWIQIGFTSRAAKILFMGLEYSIANIPVIYRKALPPVMSIVNFVLGDRDPQALPSTVDAGTENLTFPFNYHSLAIIYSRIMDMSHCHQSLRVEASPMSSHMRMIVDTQILPATYLFPYAMDVTVMGEARVCMTDQHQTAELLIGIDLLMSMVLALDKQGRVLEASILCMCFGFYISARVQFTGQISDLKDWLQVLPESPLSEWESDRGNMERMRLIRTISYIEWRALHAYLEGVHTYGYDFLEAHYESVGGMPTGDYRQYRWTRRPSFSWFGLLDHELATIHHMMALVLFHNAQYVEHLARNSITRILYSIAERNRERVNILVDAAYYAFCAWSADLGNLEYAGLLNQIVRIEPFLFLQIRDRISDINMYPYIDVDGKHQVWIGHELVQNNLAFIQFLPRVKRMARTVDVAYNPRCEADLPQREMEGSDLLRAKRIFGDVNTDGEYVGLRRIPERDALLNWDAVGLKMEDIERAFRESGRSDIAPWRSWVPA